MTCEITTTNDFKKVLSDLYDEKYDFYINNEQSKTENNNEFVIINDGTNDETINITNIEHPENDNIEVLNITTDEQPENDNNDDNIYLSETIKEEILNYNFVDENDDVEETQPIKIPKIINSSYNGNISYNGAADGLFNVILNKRIGDDVEYVEYVTCFINLAPSIICNNSNTKIYLDIPEEYKPNVEQQPNYIDFYYNNICSSCQVDVNNIVTINSPNEDGLFNIGDSLSFVSYVVILNWIRK